MAEGSCPISSNLTGNRNGGAFSFDDYRKVRNVNDIHGVFNLRDNGGRRSGIERRRFSYADHIPERRSGDERRVASDRRKREDRRNGADRRTEGANVIHIKKYQKEERRSINDRRSGVDRRRIAVF